MAVRYSRNMNGELDLVTVYRSADSDADQDAEAMLNYLAANGMHPTIVDDSAVGVVPGSYEVRVPASEASAAERLVSSFDPDAPQPADPSAELDMVPIASMMGATGEMEAIGHEECARCCRGSQCSDWRVNSTQSRVPGPRGASWMCRRPKLFWRRRKQPDPQPLSKRNASPS